MSSEEQQLYHSKSKEIDEGIRGRLSRVFTRQLKRSSDSYGYDNALIVNSKTNDHFKLYKNVNSVEFHDIFEIVQKYLPNGDCVDVHEVKSSEWSTGYEDCTCYLSDDGLSGFAITPSGDLISVFNLGQKGFLKSIKDYVKTEGAKTLDCYDSKSQHLPQIYETKHFNKDQYNEAVEYRDSFLKNDNKRYSKEKSINEIKLEAELKQKKVYSYKEVDTMVNDFINTFTSSNAKYFKNSKEGIVKQFFTELNKGNINQLSN